MILDQYIERMKVLLRKNVQLQPYLGGDVINNESRCRDISKLLLSIYVYLKSRDGNCTVENFKEYVQDEVLTYWFHSMSTDYHKIVCARMKIETGKGRALSLCKDIYYDPRDSLDFVMLMRGIVDQDINSLYRLIEDYENGNSGKD